MMFNGLLHRSLKKLGLIASRAASSNDIFRLSDYEGYSRSALAERRFYNVGAGSFYHPYWTNIDFVSDWYAEGQKEVVPYNLMKLEPLPIPENTAELIYTSHTIEHVKEDAVQNFFNESFRSLKPGGGLRVTSPDAELDYRALMRGDDKWFYWDDQYREPGTFEHLYFDSTATMTLEERWLDHVASPLVRNNRSPAPKKFSPGEIRQILEEKSLIDALNYFTGLCLFNPERPGSHICWWTHQKVMNFLRKAGFRAVYRSSYGQSAFRVLRNTRLFDNTHPQMSFYVEAIKPA